MSWKTAYSTTIGRKFYRDFDEVISLTIKVNTDETVTQNDLKITSCTIEWPEVAKEEVMQGATLQLSVISEEDMQFLPLYKLGDGNVIVSIDSNRASGVWKGVLDCDTYEEPYSRAVNYVTTLRFVDLGYLHNIDFDDTGNKSILQIVSYCLNKMSFQHTLSDETSTGVTSSSTKDLDLMYVNCDNFYDEDGKAMKCYDVIESVLAPLGAKIVQKGGVFHIYDLNGLSDGMSSAGDVQWHSNDQQLSLDKYVSRVRVTLSTYCADDLLPDSLTTPFVLDTNKYKGLYNLFQTSPGDAPCDYYSWCNSLNEADASVVAFTLFTMNNLTDAEKATINVNYESTLTLPIHINPIGGGSECDAIASCVKKQGTDFVFGNPTPYAVTSNPIMSVVSQNLQKVQDYGLFTLRLKLPALIDFRYNPFNDTNDDNEFDSASSRWKYYSHTFVPIVVELLNNSGNVTHYCCNGLYLNKLCNYQMNRYKGFYPLRSYDDDTWRDTSTWKDFWWTREGDVYKRPVGNNVTAEWVPVSEVASRYTSQGINPFLWLDYYDHDNVKEYKCGTTGGWKENHMNYGSLLEVNDTMNTNGQYIPYPPTGGRIRIKVYGGYRHMYNSCPFDVKTYPTATYEDKKSWTKGDVRWCMYKMPSLEILNNDIAYSDAVFDDIEMTCEINGGNKEDISIALTTGTSDVDMPTSKAILLYANGNQIHTLYRGGYSGTAEKLLCGSIFSQYHGRKIALSGTIPTVFGLKTYTEPHLDNKEFAIFAETADIREGTSYVKMIEVVGDNHEEE